MRCFEVNVWPNCHNAVWITINRLSLIAILNKREVGALSKAWGLVEVSQVWPDVRIVHNTLLITFENANIDLVKAD